MLYTLIPFLPLFAFLIVGIGEQWIKERAHLIAVPAMLGPSCSRYWRCTTSPLAIL